MGEAPGENPSIGYRGHTRTQLTPPMPRPHPTLPREERERERSIASVNMITTSETPYW